MGYLHFVPRRMDTLLGHILITYMDPDVLAPWKIVFLYLPMVFRAHGVGCVVCSENLCSCALFPAPLQTQLL